MSKQSKDGVVIAAKAKAAIPSRAAKPRKRQLGDPRADLPGPPQLSEEERKRLEDHAALTAKVRPVAKAKYEVDVMFSMLERALQDYKADYGLNLLPDFQRGHKWSEEQQILFVESVLRGAVTTAGLLIQFNCPTFGVKPAGDLPHEMQCVDGLQRLTAVRRFLAGEIKAFGMVAKEFTGTPFDPRRYMLRMAVHVYQTRAELLQYYIDLNAGGTPHEPEEIERVRALLAGELTK